MASETEINRRNARVLVSALRAFQNAEEVLTIAENREGELKRLQKEVERLQKEVEDWEKASGEAAEEHARLMEGLIQTREVAQDNHRSRLSEMESEVAARKSEVENDLDQFVEAAEAQKTVLRAEILGLEQRKSQAEEETRQAENAREYALKKVEQIRGA